MKIKDLPASEKPREKIATKGAAALSDFELLQAMIGSGNKQADVSKISRELLKILKNHGAELSYDQLSAVIGMGTAKVTELLAAFELAHRYLTDSEQPIIDSPQKAVEQFADIRDKKQEHFVCLTLDGANRLIAKRTITIGTLNASLVHPREVFADAITDRAASVIVAHNHPSGNTYPSQADNSVTKRLADTGIILGIPLQYHLIITKSDFSVIQPE